MLEQKRRESMPVILQEINAAENVVEALKEYIDDVTLKNVFGYSFIPRGKFLLPEGQPPFDVDSAPKNLTVSNLAYESRNFSRFVRTDLTPTKREQLYIQLLESLHKSEADLMLLVKDQTLSSVYPKITLDKVVEAGFFTWPEGLDREEYMLKKFKDEVSKVDVPKLLAPELLLQDSGTVKPPKQRGRPKKIVS